MENRAAILTNTYRQAEILDNPGHLAIGCLRNNIVNLFYYLNNLNGLNKTHGKSVLPVFG